MAPLEINKHLIILAVTIIIVTSAEIPVQGENLLIRFTEQSWIWWCKGSRNRNSWLVHQNLSGLLAGPLEWYYDCKWVLQGHWKTIKVSQISQFRYSLTNSNSTVWLSRSKSLLPPQGHASMGAHRNWQQIQPSENLFDCLAMSLSHCTVLM